MQAKTHHIKGDYYMRDYSMNLEGKVIVITGGSGVLCSEMASCLAEYGAKIAILGRRLEACEEKANKINANGGTAKGYSCDVLDKEQLHRVHEEIKKDLGPCDILINGAGGNNPKATTTEEYFHVGDEAKEDIMSFFNLDREGVEYVFNVNFVGTLLPTQEFALDMIGKEGCSIINISSMNAFTPLTKIPAYSGAKAAISNFTKWLAVHFSKENIRVNAIAPGFFATKQNQTLLFNDDGTPTARTEKILNATPMERFGKAEELNGTLLYLLNDKMSGFVTGVVIPVDGGFSAYSGV